MRWFVWAYFAFLVVLVLWLGRNQKKKRKSADCAVEKPRNLLT